MKFKPITSNGVPYGVGWYCPGCDESHHVPTTGPQAWSFNGDMERPTLTPSVVNRWKASDPDDPAAVALESVCHVVITDGRVQFCNDCTHALAGQTVDLPEIGVI